MPLLVVSPTAVSQSIRRGGCQSRRDPRCGVGLFPVRRPGYKFRDRTRRSREMIRKQRAVVGAIVSFGLGLSAWLTFMPGRSDAG